MSHVPAINLAPGMVVKTPAGQETTVTHYPREDRIYGGCQVETTKMTLYLNNHQEVEIVE